MNGQTEENFIEDIEKAVSTGICNIDFYPINNVVTQIRLHKMFRDAGLGPTSGLTKHYMNILLRKYMYSKGFLPHNGHGYVKVPTSELLRDPIVTDNYTFRYHEYIYGYEEEEYLGFGTNAISSVRGYTIVNDASRERYINNLLNFNRWDFRVGEHEKWIDESKGVILHLPYHGDLEKGRVDWKNVNPETKEALDELVDAGLIIDDGNNYKLSLEGWEYYVNLMYYLLPSNERRFIDKGIQSRRYDKNRIIEESKKSSDLLY